MRTKKLNTEQDQDAFILAISCHQKSIKLAWELNHAINCELVALEEIEEGFPYFKTVEGFPYFKWTDPTERFAVHLVANRSETGLLVPSSPQIDYYLIVTGFYEELDLDSGVKKIKQIDSVLTAFPVNLNKVK